MSPRSHLLPILMVCLVSVFLLPGNAAAATTNKLPIQIRNVYTMDSPLRVSPPKAFSMPQNTRGITAETVSLMGFSNTTYTQGNSKLTVSVGTVKGTNLVSLQYTQVVRSGTVTVLESLARNASSSKYLGILGANFAPTGTDLKLGDLFAMNYSSTETNQLAGQSVGLGAAALGDIASHNATVMKLGQYYLQMAASILTMSGMLPKSIANLNVAGTYSLTMDSTCSTICDVILVVVLSFAIVCVIVTLGVCILYDIVELDTILSVIDVGCYVECGN